MKHVDFLFFTLSFQLLNRTRRTRVSVGIWWNVPSNCFPIWPVTFSDSPRFLSPPGLSSSWIPVTSTLFRGKSSPWLCVCLCVPRKSWRPTRTWRGSLCSTVRSTLCHITSNTPEQVSPTKQRDTFYSGADGKCSQCGCSLGKVQVSPTKGEWFLEVEISRPAFRECLFHWVVVTSQWWFHVCRPSVSVQSTHSNKGSIKSAARLVPLCSWSSDSARCWKRDSRRLTSHMLVMKRATVSHSHRGASSYVTPAEKGFHYFTFDLYNTRLWRLFLVCLFTLTQTGPVKQLNPQRWAPVCSRLWTPLFYCDTEDNLT